MAPPVICPLMVAVPALLSSDRSSGRIAGIWPASTSSGGSVARAFSRATPMVVVSSASVDCAVCTRTRSTGSRKLSP